jgi:hypothetical protein
MSAEVFAGGSPHIYQNPEYAYGQECIDHMIQLEVNPANSYQQGICIIDKANTLEPVLP